MNLLRAIGRFLLGALKVLRLALPKLGVGWMFALLTSNFNRVSIVELGVMAVIVTTMIGLHHFLSPFQVIWGRIADSHPVFGLRRTPYLLLGATVASLVFLALPSVALAMGEGSVLAIVAGYALLILFGVSIAAMGDCHHALIAEVTNPKTRGGVIAVVWTFTIMSTIIAATVIKSRMPTYTPESMQALYNLTPLVVIGAALLGVLGIEKRLNREELAVALERARAAAPPGNPLSAALGLLRENPQVRAFFGFVFLSIVGIFLQDSILEVFGAEVFHMTLKETTTFTQTWGGGVLGGMLIMGLLSAIFPIGKKLIALIGGVGTAFGLGLLAVCALTEQRALLNPAIVLMGVSTGLYNVGALSLMMDMTVEGATGLYMGMWGMAQAFGTATANILAGALHTVLIEAQALSQTLGYGVIFGLEAVLMVIGIALLSGVSVEAFRGLTRSDITRAMEAGAVA